MSDYLKTVYSEEERPITKYPNQLAGYLKKRFFRNKEIFLVDIGCGRGDFLRAFRNISGVSAVGVDIADSVVEHGERIIHGNINLEEDILPFDDNSVDVVFTKSVLEHIHNPLHLMKECKRIMKPGGLIIAMVPDWHSCMYSYYDDFTHVQPYTKIGLRDLLRVAGFSSVESEIFYQLPIVWKHPSVRMVCKLVQFFFGKSKSSEIGNKFIFFSRELMVLAVGNKQA